MSKITNYYDSASGGYTGEWELAVSRIIGGRRGAVAKVDVYRHDPDDYEQSTYLDRGQLRDLRNALTTMINNMDAEEEEPPVFCGRSIRMGSQHDPYGTECDLQLGHEGEHEGPHPLLEDERISWTGGGSAAGDALPYHIAKIDKYEADYRKGC